MRRFLGLALFLAMAAAGILFCSAGEYKLLNGDILKGEAASFNEDGMIVRLELGGFSPRVPWGKFTQETLKELSSDPKARKFVEPFIEIPPEIKEKKREKKKEIVVKEPPRVENPVKSRFFASLGAPPFLALLGILWAANIYAGVEIARFKYRPVPLVAAASAVFPIVGPILFLAIPAAHAPAPDLAAAPTEETAPAAAPDPRAAAPASGLGLAAHGAPAAKASSNPAYNQVYNRSNTSFDRRFFEAKFSGFFRTIPSDAEKDMVLVVKTQKNEYIGKRISRISMTEMHMQLQRGATEVSVPFTDIVEVSVRHKDAAK